MAKQFSIFKVATMIKNEQQYYITKVQVQKFEQAIAKLTECSEEINQVNPLLWKVKKSAIESQLNELHEEIKAYELLNCYQI
jgi:hypothetical protein